MAGCAYRGPSDNPIVRHLSWFSYLNGDDIRAACRAGGLDRYRLVYNARYTEQVRTYDIEGSPWRDGNALEARVLGPPDLSKGLSLTDPLAAWRGTTGVALVSDVDFALLKETLAKGGLGEAAPGGLRLPSDGYYWIVVGCRDGRVAFNAYRHPSERFGALRFPDLLARLDPTHVPFRRPPPPGAPQEPTYDEPEEPGPIAFELVVSPEGRLAHILGL